MGITRMIHSTYSLLAPRDMTFWQANRSRVMHHIRCYSLLLFALVSAFAFTELTLELPSNTVCQERHRYLQDIGGITGNIGMLTSSSYSTPSGGLSTAAAGGIIAGCI